VNKKWLLLPAFVALLNYKTSHSEIEKVGIINYKHFEDMVYSMNFPYPEVVIAQARLETGHFKSEVFRMNNNLFGMRHPLRRVTLSKGSNLNHAVYGSWKHSLMDYAMWYNKYCSRFKTKEELYVYLQRVYSTNENYIKILKTIE
tara:strand:+ start:418 stop:852 length:435 start_codon:yes stop_codon:yes gene_type:complete